MNRITLRCLPAITFGACAFLCAPLALSHDSWIEPTQWRPAAEALIGVNVFVGHDGERELLAREQARIVRMFVSLPAAEGELRAATELPGAEGRAPAGYLRVQRPGLHAVGYRTRNSTIELEPAKFETYLVEEGLERVLEERARLGERERPGREAYSRCAKSLVLAGDGPSDGFDQPIGLTLELVPLDDPFALASGAVLRVQVLHDGRPVEGLLVEAERMGASEGVSRKLQALSNAEGVASFTLGEADAGGWPGAWLIAAVHMLRAEPGLEHDWESLWASLTFEASGPELSSRAANAPRK